MESVKTMKISEELHTKIKEYCNKNNLKMGKWIEFVLNTQLKKNMKYVTDQKS